MPCSLDAFVVSSTEGWTLAPAPGKRDWMDETPGKFAYRCLPLVMANQAGWVVGCPLDFSLVWDGGDAMGAIRLDFPRGEGRNAGQIRSHFGSGVLTFSLPWLFRTSPGFGLWVRGPANTMKDNMQPLDGVVETDWAPYTFTMNWRVMRPNIPVSFRKGDPICMLVPFPLALLEEVKPRVRQLSEDPVLEQDFKAFVAGRGAVIKAREQKQAFEYQMDYMRGHLPDGSVVTTHRKAFKLAEFEG